MQPVASLTAALECALTTLGRLRNAAVSIVRESATNCARTIEIIFWMLLISSWENNRRLKYRTPPKLKYLSKHRTTILKAFLNYPIRVIILQYNIKLRSLHWIKSY